MFTFSIDTVPHKLNLSMIARKGKYKEKDIAKCGNQGTVLTTKEENPLALENNGICGVSQCDIRQSAHRRQKCLSCRCCMFFIRSLNIKYFPFYF